MGAHNSPMLAVSDGAAAIDFYKEAFGAVELWRIDAGGDVVAGLSVHGAEFFLAQETPSRGTRAPDGSATRRCGSSCSSTTRTTCSRGQSPLGPSSRVPLRSTHTR